MPSRWQPRQWALTLLCVMLLAARVDAAHLHLCLDGQEKASSVHTVHMGPDVHAHGSSQAPHSDVDLALAGDLVAKPGKGDVDPPVALPASHPAIVPAAARFSAPIAPAAASFPGSPVLLPPQRGPPASLTS